jgi:hypothetical protein
MPPNKKCPGTASGAATGTNLNTSNPGITTNQAKLQESRRLAGVRHIGDVADLVLAQIEAERAATP